MVTDATIYLLIAAMGFGTFGAISALAIGLYGYFRIISYREDQLNKRAGMKAQKAAMNASGGQDSEADFITQILGFLPYLQQLQQLQKPAGSTEQPEVKHG